MKRTGRDEPSVHPARRFRIKANPVRYPASTLFSTFTNSASLVPPIDISG